MTITSIGRDFLNNVSIVGFTATDNLATISSANYIKNQQHIIDALNKGPWGWFDTDTILVNASDGNAFYEFTDDTFSSLVLMTSPTGGTVSPGTMGNVAYYPATGNTIAGTNNLPNQVQVPVGSLAHGVGANATTFWRGDGTWSSGVVPISIPSSFVYVANDGSDTGGDGSFTNPYQTIAHAMASITSASISNVFNIILLDSIFNETVQILLKEFVLISSNNPNVLINNSLPIILDTVSWTSNVPFGYYSNFTITGDLTIDFTTVVPTSFLYIQLNTITVEGIFTFNGGHFNSPNGGAGIDVFSCQFFTTVNIDCANSYVSQGSIYTGTLNISTLDASNFCNAFHFGDSVQAVNVGKTPMTANVFYTVTGSSLLSLSLTDVASSLKYTSDDSSYVTPTVSLGAPLIVLKSISNGLKANYSPTNYTPAATTPTLTTSVQAHLHGIDNKLGTLVSEGLVWNDVTGTTQAAAVNNAYATDNVGLVTVTLPATAAFGDRIAIQGKGSGGWSCVANTGQTIHVGNAASTVAGHVASTNQWDCIELVCVTANTTWSTRSMIGNLTIA